MEFQSDSVIKLFSIGLLGLLVILIHILLQPSALIRDMDHRLNSIGYDLRSSFGNPLDLDHEFIHLRIDESSFPSNLSYYPINRQWLGKLIKKISEKEPKLIVLNLILDRPTSPLDDQVLAESLKAAEQIVIRESSQYPTLSLFKNSVRAAGVLILKEDSTSTVQMVCNSAKTCGKEAVLHQNIWNVLHPDEPYSATFPGNDWLKINYHSPNPEQEIQILFQPLLFWKDHRWF